MSNLDIVLHLLLMHELVILVAKYGIAVPAAAYIVLAYWKRKSLRELLVLTVISAVLTIVLVKIATILHSDPRPFVRDGVRPYFASSTDNGFPSDHTAVSGMLAFIVFRYHRWAGLALLLVALLIGAARVKAGVHHGQDVLGAVAIAAASVCIGSLVTNAILRKAKPAAE